MKAEYENRLSSNRSYGALALLVAIGSFVLFIRGCDKGQLELIASSPLVSLAALHCLKKIVEETEKIEIILQSRDRILDQIEFVGLFSENKMNEILNLVDRYS